jgi:hypothetical protein
VAGAVDGAVAGAAAVVGTAAGAAAVVGTVGKQTGRQAGRQAGKQAGMQRGRQAERAAGRQACRQAQGVHLLPTACSREQPSSLPSRTMTLSHALRFCQLLCFLGGGLFGVLLLLHSIVGVGLP